ncbi:MAG: DUF2497 domain-containing protein [Rhizobiales bacterium]|nr:DUF2497 domain-containing protein [Hyphomicrobiales bacterium]
MIAQQRAHEPSMEEILASIRRIIADDQRAPARPAAPGPMLAPDRPANLDAAPLREAREDEAIAPAPRATTELFDDVFPPPLRAVPSAAEIEPAAEPAPAAAAPAETIAEAEEEIVELSAPVAAPALAAAATTTQILTAPAFAAPSEAHLLSSQTDAAVTAQFETLASALMANNARRLDDMTRDLLRPLLKTWLDDNLPVLVERLVKAEIERVARGGR